MRFVRTIAVGFHLLALMISGSPGAAWARDDVRTSAKLSLRLGNGILKNTGTDGGSATTLLAPDLVFDYFLFPRFALGIGYFADFDFSRASTARRGPDVSFRYYLTGSGTRSDQVSKEVRVSSRDSTSFYAGSEFSQRDYYLGSNRRAVSSIDVNGSYSTLNLILGVDRLIAPEFDFNAELTHGIAVFAGSDDRYAIRSTMIRLGFSYLFP